MWGQVGQARHSPAKSPIPPHSTSMEFLLEEWGVCAPHQAYQPLGPAPERQASKMSGFEKQWGFHPGEPRGVGNWDSTLKGLTHRTDLPPRTQHISSSLKSAWTIREEIPVQILKYLQEGRSLLVLSFQGGWWHRQLPLLHYPSNSHVPPLYLTVVLLVERLALVAREDYISGLHRSEKNWRESSW